MIRIHTIAAAAALGLAMAAPAWAQEEAEGLSLEGEISVVSVGKADAIWWLSHVFPAPLPPTSAMLIGRSAFIRPPLRASLCKLP